MIDPGIGLSEWMRQTLPLTLVLAFVIDLLIGDPQQLPHPVKLIGRVIRFAEQRLNKTGLPENVQRARGILLAFFIPCGLTLVLTAVLGVIYRINPFLHFLIRIILAWQLLAMKDLAKEASDVANVLRTKDIYAARRQVSRIVGRETDQLSASECIKATVETVAENFCDGVMAPLLFLLVADIPGMFFYKCVNTLDSMVGYRNQRYLYFGRASARLDDVLNYLPARVSAILLLAAARIEGLDVRSAWRIFLRDRNKHLSPNSGQCESVAAGALHIRLGGTHRYHGQDIVKPTIGDNDRQPEIADIDKTVRMLYLGSVLGLLLCLILAWSKWRYSL